MKITVRYTKAGEDPVEAVLGPGYSLALAAQSESARETILDNLAAAKGPGWICEEVDGDDAREVLGRIGDGTATAEDWAAYRA